jgi:hypothetical protein
VIDKDSELVYNDYINKGAIQMEVVSIADRGAAKKKADLLEVLNDLIAKVESGQVEEFVAASADADGEVEIHVCAMDMVGSVGLFEIGKHILISGN